MSKVQPQEQHLDDAETLLDAERNRLLVLFPEPDVERMLHVAGANADRNAKKT